MENKFVKVNISFSVFVPADIAADEDKTEDYLNEKMWTDSDFFGYIDQGCFNVTNEILEY